jgi:ribosomal protein L37E
MRAMPDAPRSGAAPVVISPTPVTTRSVSSPADIVVCERCGGANVYRMHAVWRCADCGFKTDCCGW